MADRTKLLQLLAIMTIVALAGSAAAIYILYKASIDEERDRLRETVQSRARILESVAQYDLEHYRLHYKADSYEKAALDASFKQFNDAHEKFKGFGNTGEFVIAKRKDDKIIFLMQQRHAESGIPDPVPFSSDLAEPMRRALKGQSGTIIGLDYRGAKVLAAYEPVGVYDLALVAKIDLAEVRAPFFKAGFLALIIAIFFIVIGTILFMRIGNPIIAKLQFQAHELMQSEKRFRKVIESDMIGILFWDNVGNITNANDLFLKMIGYSRKELQSGKLLWTDITPDEYLDQDRKAMEEVSSTGSIIPIEKEYIRKDGVRIPIILGAASIPGPTPGGVAFVLDISERKKSEKLIKDSLDEKEALLREIHHRVKNNLQVISSMLNLQSRKLKGTPEADLLQDSRSRIQSMAQIHESLYMSEDLRHVHLDDFIKSIAKNLFRLNKIDYSKIELGLDIAQVSLEIQHAIPCGMILNELLSNSLSHAFKNHENGFIGITMIEKDNRLFLHYEDNGAGLPENFHPEKSDSLGLKLIGTFVKQLKGELDISSNNGLHVKISFPRA